MKSSMKSKHNMSVFFLFFFLESSVLRPKDLFNYASEVCAMDRSIEIFSGAFCLIATNARHVVFVACTHVMLTIAAGCYC